MHPDRKIGIAMGILLVGVVGALFFRNEPLQLDEHLSLQREAELNERLRERDVAVYLDGATVGGDSQQDDRPVWTLKEVLGQPRQADEAQPIVTPAKAPTAVRVPEAITYDPPSPDDVPLPRARGTYTQDGGIVGVQHRSDPQTVDLARLEPMTDVAGPAVDEGFEEYKVQYGDTLSGISQKFLGSVNRYSEIYSINRDRIKNPDSLRVGTAIRIPKHIH